MTAGMDTDCTGAGLGLSNQWKKKMLLRWIKLNKLIKDSIFCDAAMIYYAVNLTGFKIQRVMLTDLSQVNYIKFKLSQFKSRGPVFYESLNCSQEQ